MNIAHLDYEARSGVDITEVGSHRFSIDPQFEILLAGVSRDGEDRVYLWVNPLFQTIDMMGENEEVEKILNEADLVYAHNAQNEQANTWGAFQQGKACPFWKEPPITIWRCTAAMSRKAGLPGGLEKVSDALNLPVKKDSRNGKRLINIFCAPDEDTGLFVDPASRPDDWIAFGEYNCTDVVAEKGVHHRLKPFELTGAALETFQFDLRMNQRGIPINVEAARHAQIIIDQEQSGVTEQFKKITGLRPSQKKKLKVWFDKELGLKLANMQAPTIEAEVEYRTTLCLSVDTLKSRRILEILTLYQKVGYSAVAKIAKMLECVCPDGRVRGGHMYHGAGTGRWSGRLLQPQNFKKCPPWMRSIAEEIYKLICSGVSRDYLDYLYGDPLELISGIIRHFIHILGQPIFDGDYAQVEARIICWLAGQLDVLERWRKGEDLYKWMASHVYGIRIDQVTDDQREVGKRIILGCGFQMGWVKFQNSCWTQYQLRVPDEICQRGVKLFRQLCKKIRDYWWVLNNQALSAVRNPGAEFGPFRMRKIAGIPFLLFRLKSGRSLAYPHPEINLVKWENHGKVKDEEEVELDEWGLEKPEEIEYKEELTYWGEVKDGVWGRVKLYGGKLAENETQATAADFMSHGLIQAERDGMEPFMTVHDQGLAPVTEGRTAADFERSLGTLPDWAQGFPMKVEVKVTPYYKK